MWFVWSANNSFFSLLPFLSIALVHLPHHHYMRKLTRKEVLRRNIKYYQILDLINTLRWLQVTLPFSQSTTKVRRIWLKNYSHTLECLPSTPYYLFISKVWSASFLKWNQDQWNKPYFPWTHKYKSAAKKRWFTVPYKGKITGEFWNYWEEKVYKDKNYSKANLETAQKQLKETMSKKKFRKNMPT